MVLPLRRAASPVPLHDCYIFCVKFLLCLSNRGIGQQCLTGGRGCDRPHPGILGALSLPQEQLTRNLSSQDCFSSEGTDSMWCPPLVRAWGCSKGRAGSQVPSKVEDSRGLSQLVFPTEHPTHSEAAVSTWSLCLGDSQGSLTGERFCSNSICAHLTCFPSPPQVCIILAEWMDKIQGAE